MCTCAGFSDSYNFRHGVAVYSIYSYNSDAEHS